jgi:hypothetical protein
MTMTRSIPYWTTSLFSSAVTDLDLIYGSVTSSASVVRWLTLHSWTFNSLTNAEWLNSRTNSESESESLYDWRFTANQSVLALSPLRLTARFFFFQLNTCGHSPYITSSLTRGWVSNLQLLLTFPSAFILGPESRGTRDHILLSQFRDFPSNRLLRLAELWRRYSTPPP